MTGEAKVKWANPEPPIHHAIARWAAACAERTLSIFEEQCPDDDRPSAPNNGKAWTLDLELRRIGFPKGL